MLRTQRPGRLVTFFRSSVSPQYRCTEALELRTHIGHYMHGGTQTCTFTCISRLYLHKCPIYFIQGPRVYEVSALTQGHLKTLLKFSSFHFSFFVPLSLSSRHLFCGCQHPSSSPPRNLPVILARPCTYSGGGRANERPACLVFGTPRRAHPNLARRSGTDGPLRTCQGSRRRG